MDICKYTARLMPIGLHVLGLVVYIHVHVDTCTPNGFLIGERY